jgi:GntP family gluconate:H+ symporter
MLGPIACLFIGIAMILFMILYLKLHPILALISAAVAVALLSDQILLDNSLPLVAEQFGVMMQGLGILIVLAAIIGKCLMDSGAADRIVRAFMRAFGEGKESYALLFCGFTLSVPVFFDTVFYLLAPLARAAYARTKRDYVLFITVIAAGGVVAHALVPPTPGPIAVAEILGVSVGMAMLVGILAAIVPVLAAGIFYSRWINHSMPIVPGAVLGVSEEELEATAQKPDSELPGLFASCLPVIFPVVLLAGTAILKSTTNDETLLVWLKLLGDKNLVFLLGAGISIWLVVAQNRLDFQGAMKRLEPAVASGAVIAFITCAGGSFGKVLAAAGVGDVIENVATDWGISLLVMGFLTATLMRIAQGSATVAMITAAGIIAPALENASLSYHPVYLISAVGFGAVGFPWMNDSGFWLFGRLTGLSEIQTFKTWSAVLTIVALTGFAWVYVLTKILPLT